MALQATLTLLGLTGLATTAAVLCALVLTWWALGTRDAPPASADEVKPNPLDSGAPGARVRAGAGPAGLDPDVDFEAFQAQIQHDFGALRVQIRRRCDLTFQDLGIDSADCGAQIERQCDLELDALCESAMDDQSAKVLQDLEDEFEGGPVGAQAATGQPAGPEPWMDFEANVALHSDRALEGMWSHANDAVDGALDGMCAAVLKALEDECRDSNALDDVKKCCRLPCGVELIKFT